MKIFSEVSCLFVYFLVFFGYFVAFSARAEHLAPFRSVAFCRFFKIFDKLSTFPQNADRRGLFAASHVYMPNRSGLCPDFSTTGRGIGAAALLRRTHKLSGPNPARSPSEGRSEGQTKDVFDEITKSYPQVIHIFARLSTAFRGRLPEGGPRRRAPIYT